jgi:hypothetical protein
VRLPGTGPGYLWPVHPSPAARLIPLSALRWFGVGLVIPVLVLLLTARGLPVERVGQVLAVYGAATLLSELPTGGLADSWGRRPVVLLSALVHSVGLMLLAFFSGLAWILMAAVLLGVARALASGPVESWFVDAMHEGGQQAGVQRGLAHGQVAESLGLGVGSVVGGQLPRAAQGLPESGPGLLSLSVPFIAAAAVSLLFAVAAAASLRPTGVAASASAAGAVVMAVKDTVQRAPVRRLILVAMFLGVVLSGVELLAPKSVAEAAGDPTRGAALYGVLAAAGFGFAALGASLSARSARRGTAAAAFAVAALAALGIAVPTVGVSAASYGLLYLAVGLQGPVMAGLLHQRVRPQVRSTMLSVESLALQFGGVCAGLVVGAAAGWAGLEAGFAVVSVAAMAAVAVILRDRRVEFRHSV